MKWPISSLKVRKKTFWSGDMAQTDKRLTSRYYLAQVASCMLEKSRQKTNVLKVEASSWIYWMDRFLLAFLRMAISVLVRRSKEIMFKLWYLILILRAGPLYLLAKATTMLMARCASKAKTTIRAARWETSITEACLIDLTYMNIWRLK